MIRLSILLPGIGKVEIEGEEAPGVIAQAAFWGELPKACPVCSASLRLQHRSPKGFEYYGLICSGQPAHETNFGQKKVTGELYYKGAGFWRLSPGAPYEEE